MTTEFVGSRLTERILLSGPDVGPAERDALLRAVDGGWIAPVGPELAAFERELADYVDAEACVALSSGTAALHLALLGVGVEPGDEVVVQTATFAASAFAVTYCGASPVFCDVDHQSWTLCPSRLEEFLTERAEIGRLPAAVMVVDLYGSCGDYPALQTICDRFEVALVEDAAEALGSETSLGRAGRFGSASVVSFNGNKIITTSGGGALLGSQAMVDRARFLSTQARQPVPHYEHHDIGFNYRMSNLLAALGRAQLGRLEEIIARRSAIAARYRSDERLAVLEWGEFVHTKRPNNWLNVALLPQGVSPTEMCRRLDHDGIEARPAWMPMHVQPVFAGCETVGGEVAEELFARGLALPSGAGLSDDDVERVVVSLAAALKEVA